VRLHPRAKSVIKSMLAASARIGGTITHVATRQPLAALTFDDGPNPEATPHLLDLLAAHGARATFFMVGEAAVRHSEIVARAVSEGHAVANHSWDHPSFPLLSSSERRRQIERCAAALGPRGERLFRPPWGHQSVGSRWDAARAGHAVVAWSAMAEDWLDDPADVLAARVRPGLAPGAIVLLHDALYRTIAERYRDRAPMLAAVDALLREFAARLRFVTVPELLRAGRPRKWHWYKPADRAWLVRQI
jgi:peptidoglycan/xylan/chitin deacetylase (PgdA/CDA1 family)